MLSIYFQQPPPHFLLRFPSASSPAIVSFQPFVNQVSCYCNFLDMFCFCICQNDTQTCKCFGQYVYPPFDLSWKLILPLSVRSHLAWRLAQSWIWECHLLQLVGIPVLGYSSYFRLLGFHWSRLALCRFCPIQKHHCGDACNIRIRWKRQFYYQAHFRSANHLRGICSCLRHGRCCSPVFLWIADTWDSHWTLRKYVFLLRIFGTT